MFAGVGVERRPIGRGVVAEAGVAGDHAALGLDRLELVEADPVDLLGVEVERRPAPDRGPVELLAVGRRPEARILAGRRQVVAAERVEEGEVGRDRRRRGRPRGRARGPPRTATLTIDGTIADSIGTSSIRSIWAMVRSATMRGAVSPDAMPVAQDLGVGGHERRVGVEPGDERLEALGRVGRLELGQLRQELLRTAHLVDDAQLVEALVVLLDVELGDDLEHVPGDPVLGRQPVGVDGGRLGGGPLHQRPAARRPAGPGSSRRSA